MSALDCAPTLSKKSSTMKFFEMEAESAVSMAAFRPALSETFVTPLLPAESTGFTMTGQLK